MIQTAENMAKKIGLTKHECDAASLRRYQQYLDSLANNRAFQKRYMFPVEIKIGRKETKLVEKVRESYLPLPKGLPSLLLLSPEVCTAMERRPILQMEIADLLSPLGRKQKSSQQIQRLRFKFSRTALQEPKRAIWQKPLFLLQRWLFEMQD